MNTNTIKLMVPLLISMAACKNNPFGKDVYKGKVIDATTGKGIPRARVEVRARKTFKGFGYTIEGTAFTDEDGNYAVSYERERKHSYLIYAFKEGYSEDDNYAWGDRKHTDINLNPFAYVKVRAINQSNRYNWLGFDALANGRLAEIRNCDMHPDTVMGNFTIPGNKDYEFIYRLSDKNGDYESRVIPMRVKEFELDSICIVY